MRIMVSCDAGDSGNFCHVTYDWNLHQPQPLCSNQQAEMSSTEQAGQHTVELDTVLSDKMEPSTKENIEPASLLGHARTLPWEFTGTVTGLSR